MVNISSTKLSNTNRWIDADPEHFDALFNRKSFEVFHNLATHPLLELPQLMQLAERTLKTRPRSIHYDCGTVRVEQRWDQIPQSPLSVKEALRQVESCGAWFVLSSAQRDPAYRIFLDRGLADIKARIGPNIDSQIVAEDIIVFITSPKRVTTYHIDRECNFLLQIRGSKTLYVFDRDDREVLPENEIERFWSVDFNAAIYKPQFQQRARSYVLRPGTGVHIPVNCPHWIENHDNVSVSLSVNFQYRDTLRGNVYRANFLLRKLGLNPTPPGQAPRVDALKSYGVVPFVLAKQIVKRVLNL